MRISVIVPAYNEAATIAEALRRITAVGLDLEVVVVDDGSTDGTGDLADAFARDDPRVRVLRHGRNRGKGAALRTGFAAATGAVVIPQDAIWSTTRRSIRS